MHVSDGLLSSQSSPYMATILFPVDTEAVTNGSIKKTKEN